MSRTLLHTHGARLSEDIVLAVEGVSRAARRGDPQPPRSLARLLPGVQWSVAGDRSDDEDDDDELDEMIQRRRKGVLKEVSFELAPGQGLGLVGDDATTTLLGLLIGLYPPTTGRIIVRGRIAPLLRFGQLDFSGYTGKASLKVISRFLRWPPDFLRRRWPEIVDFARLEEIDDLGLPPDSLEYSQERTKRLLLSAVMHLDASVYAVFKGFAGKDERMFERCSEVLRQRQQEGCAIVHTAGKVADVAAYCQEAILFEDGAPIMRGRLGLVASVMLERREAAKEKAAGAWRFGRGLLAAGDGGILLGRNGGKIELELDVFGTADVTLGLRLADERGRETTLEYGEVLEATPGIYRLTIVLPGALLEEGSNTATLFATRRLRPGTPEEELQSAEVLSFEVASETGDDEPTPEFGVAGDKGELANPGDVEWDVRRVED